MNNEIFDSNVENNDKSQLHESTTAAGSMSAALLPPANAMLATFENMCLTFILSIGFPKKRASQELN